MLGTMLRLLVSRGYRDVLPFYQKSRVLREVDDLVHAACEAHLDGDPDIVALLATVAGRNLGLAIARRESAGSAQWPDACASIFKLMNRFDGGRS